MKFCYINLTKHIPARDIIYLNGLKKIGAEVFFIQDSSPSLKKFWAIFKKHWPIRNGYDVLWVGYSGHILVPFARLISRKPIVFNCLGSLYEGTVITRKRRGIFHWRAAFCWVVDFLSFNSASLSMVESNIQKQYIIKKFFIKPQRLGVYWTGVDDQQFFHDPYIPKLPVFTVVFRGNLQTGCGVEILIEAAKILKNGNIHFRIVGSGMLEDKVVKMLDEFDSNNIEWMRGRFLPEFLSNKMQECHLSLGWLDNEERATRTLPHKIFESMATKIPCLTGRQPGVMELLDENETCFYFNPGDAKDLADKISDLSDKPELLKRVANNAYELYDRRLRQEILAQKLLGQISTLRI